MDFGADMMGDQANDPLAIVCGKRRARIAEAVTEPVDPEATARIEHHFDNGGFVEPGRNIRAKRGAEHAGTALDRC